MAATSPVRSTSQLTLSDLDATEVWGSPQALAPILLEDTHLLAPREFNFLDERIDWTGAVAFTGSRVRAFLHVDVRNSRFFRPTASAWTGYGADGVDYLAGAPTGAADATWQSETPVAGRRGSRVGFPPEVYLVATDDEVSIMDVRRGGELWLRFPIRELDVERYYRGILFRSPGAQGPTRLRFADGNLVVLTAEGEVLLLSFAADGAALYRPNHPFRTALWSSNLADRYEVLSYQKVLHTTLLAGTPTELALAMRPLAPTLHLLVGTSGGLTVVRVADLTVVGALASSDSVSSADLEETTAVLVDSSERAVWASGGVLRRSAAVPTLAAGFAAAATATVGSRIQHIVGEPAGRYYVGASSGIHLVDLGVGSATHLFSAAGGGGLHAILPGGSSVSQLRHVVFGSQEYLVAALTPPNRRVVVVNLATNLLLRDFPVSSFVRRGTLAGLARRAVKVNG